MVFPWNRSDAATQMAPAERRRRARQRRARTADPRRRSERSSQERDRQRLLIVVGSTLILVIVAIIAVGYFREFYQPPRVMAGEIRGVNFTMGDLVKRIRVLQGIGRYSSGGFVDLSTVPFEILQDMINAEVLRQASPGLGITVTPADIDQTLKGQFSPTVPPGQETDPGQVEKEFQENYQKFRTATGLSQTDYRVILQERLAEQQLRFLLGSGIPAMPEQVEVEWINLGTGQQRGQSIVPADVKKRLATEDFAAVAAEVGTQDGFANESGYVGWVPKGAFPDLDETLFGSEKPEPATADPKNKVEPLAVGAISDPIATRDGTYIVRNKNGPETHELAPNIKSKLNTELVKKWHNDQLSRGSNEGWLKMNFNSEKYAWVAEQVRVSAPRTNPSNQNPNAQQNQRTRG